MVPGRDGESDPGGWVDVFHVPDQGREPADIRTHRPFAATHWVHLSIRIRLYPFARRLVEVRQTDRLVARCRRVMRSRSCRLELRTSAITLIPTLTTVKVCKRLLTISGRR